MFKDVHLSLYCSMRGERVTLVSVLNTTLNKQHMKLLEISAATKSRKPISIGVRRVGCLCELQRGRLRYT